MIQKFFLGLVILVATGVVGLSLVKIPAPSTEIRQTVEADKIFKTTLAMANNSQVSL